MATAPGQPVLAEVTMVPLLEGGWALDRVAFSEQGSVPNQTVCDVRTPAGGAASMPRE